MPRCKPNVNKGTCLLLMHCCVSYLLRLSLSTGVQFVIRQGISELSRDCPVIVQWVMSLCLMSLNPGQSDSSTFKYTGKKCWTFWWFLWNAFNLIFIQNHWRSGSIYRIHIGQCSPRLCWDSQNILILNYRNLNVNRIVQIKSSD